VPDVTRAATLQAFVRANHPDRLLEPLDASAPTDLPILGPTVIVEVVGAREALDALARVRRIARESEVAAVRVAVPEIPVERPRVRPSWRHVITVVAAGALVVGGVLATRWGSSVVSTAVGVSALALAPVLVLAAVVEVRRARREPLTRRRYFERRRSIAVIAVPAADGPAATTLASTVRRELDAARPGNGRYDVTVLDPP
jgi:hypothetical protein